MKFAKMLLLEINENKNDNMMKHIIGFKGEILWDSTKPDGTPRKLLDVHKIHKIGWKHKYSLLMGIEKYYKFYAASQTN